MAELMIIGGLAAGGGATAGLTGLIGGTAIGGSLVSAFSQKKAFDMQARQSEFNAKLERLEGRRQSLDISRQLERDLASQNALFAARGGGAGEGSALAVAGESRSAASEAIDNARFNASVGALGREQQASNLKAQGKAALIKGVTDVAITGAKLAGGGV